MYCKSKIKVEDILNALKEANLFIRNLNDSDESLFNGIATDSRQIRKNYVFICIKGFLSDGNEFISQAISLGATLIITEEEITSSARTIQVKNSRRAAAVLSSLFFGKPAQKLKLIGITGTNGKTTIASLIHQLLIAKGYNAGLIGTLGYKIGEKEFHSDRTTPDIIDLQNIFAEMVESGTEFVVMEVSSHSLALDRVFGLEFDLAVFSNLSIDHLDFHRNMEDYAKAKFQLFNMLKPDIGTAIINIDDDYGKTLFDKLVGRKISISFHQGDFLIESYESSISGTKVILSQPYEIEFDSLFIGKHNVFNITAALACVTTILPQIDWFPLLKSLQPVPGRLQQIPNKKGICILVDYAHTPEALSNVLSAIKSFAQRRILCVFGAGGDRDRTKRPMMLNEVLKYADLAIITNDNPRWEKPAEIISDIVGNRDHNRTWIIQDRKTAIETAINAAQKNDCVLIAGKGHENYQEIRGEKFHFDDSETAQLALQKELKNGLELPIDPLQLGLIFGKQIHNTSPSVIKNISTDSRNIKPDSLFIPLKGDNFDGHVFIPEVLKTENCWALAEPGYTLYHPRIIPVESTLKGLGILAARYRKLFAIRVIALTGSSGKTTTKEYLANILEQKYRTLKTAGNENNLIGLPKTVFKLKNEHEIAILELGTNQFGEIDQLTDIADPEISLITSIGPCHLEFLKNEEGVFQEKTAIFKQEKTKKFFPGDDERFGIFKGTSFGKKDDNDYVLKDIKTFADHCSFSVNSVPYSIPTPFPAFCHNALIAIALADQLHIPTEDIQKGLNKTLQIENRMQIRCSGERIILADCYNANPQSMRAAIEFWLSFEKKRKHIAILGDMLELGELTEKYHRDIWQSYKEEDVQVISVGDFARFYNAAAHFPNVEELLASDILESLALNSVILVKGSHSIKLEKILGRL